MKTDHLDFEDFLFEVYTPGSIDRKVLNLDSAWQLLRQKEPNNQFVVGEVKAWERWSKEILDSSWLYKTLPTGIMDELDGWAKRYELAYKSISNKANLVKPDTFIEEVSVNNPALWVTLGIFTAIGIYFYAQSRKK